MIKELLEAIKTTRPVLAPLNVWQAYKQVEKVNGKSPKNELTALVSLIRRVSGIDKTLTSYEQTVNRNFQTWVFDKQAGALKFNEEQMAWLRMIKDHITRSIQLEKEDWITRHLTAKAGLGR